MSQLVFNLYQNPREVDPNAREGMDLLARQGQAGGGQSFLLPCAFYRLLAEGVTLMRGGSLLLKELDYKWIFLLQTERESLTGVSLYFGVLVNSRCSKVYNQE